jgi:hypothetical protein
LVHLVLLVLLVLPVRLVVMEVSVVTLRLGRSSLPTVVAAGVAVPSRLLQQAVVEVAVRLVLAVPVVLLAALVVFLRQLPTQLAARV